MEIGTPKTPRASSMGHWPRLGFRRCAANITPQATTPTAKRTAAICGDGTAPAGVGADGPELLAQPADADTEDHAAAGQCIECRDQLRGDDGVAVRHHIDADAEPDALRNAAEIGERQAVGEDHAGKGTSSRRSSRSGDPASRRARAAE